MADSSNMLGRPPVDAREDKGPQQTPLRLLIWTVIGVAIYAFYGYRHSALRNRVS